MRGRASRCALRAVGGVLVKREWFKSYSEDELPARFYQIVQSWDTANKISEFSSFSVLLFRLFRELSRCH